MAELDVAISASPIAVRRVTVCLLIAVAVLVVLHLAALAAPREMSFETVRAVLDDFNLDRENTLPSWFTSVLLLIAGALMVGIGVRARRRGERPGRRWILLGCIFMLLSLDEAASFHEITIHTLREPYGLTGIFYWSWVIPGLAFVAILGIAYLPFLFALPAATQWGLMAAAAVYLSGALAMEMVGGVVASSGPGTDSRAYRASVTIEETLELLGLVVLLHVLMMHAFVPRALPAAPSRAAVRPPLRDATEAVAAVPAQASHG